ncbi:MAG TPA: AAA family ATPase [Acidimicrobiales bacterium]|nr:AAA family ATPase [Acidimicrobiales bacterium]
MPGDHQVVHETASAAVAETHTAVITFVGDRAYKLKKPVDLGFLDFRSREARALACAREVELNRRLAPDVYLGVADVVGPGGELCDHLVVMRRMPAARRLATLVRAGADVDDGLWHLAHLLAAFHARAERSEAADDAARAASLRCRWADNTRGLLDHGRGVVDEAEVGRVDELAAEYLAGREPLFEQRIADGRAVDGHGDLLADDIFLLDDGPRVLDCIEFDDRLRHDDTLADVAFLAMDLEHLGRPDLGERFLAAYREHAGDAWPASLAHHHVAYRAQVRAKVAAIRTGQGDTAAAEDARALLGLCHRRLEAGRVRLVLVGGLPGTGKSTLAAGLGEVLDATVLRSDEVRKDLAGIDPRTPASAAYGEGLYRAGTTEGTYRAMLDRAAVALGHGESVVLDASWTRGRWRARARELGATAHATVAELRCEAPAEVAAGRIEQRRRAAADASDATPAVAEAMRRDAEPWPESTAVLTTGAPADTLAAARAVVLPVAPAP